MDINKRFPSVAYLERAARQRIPGFVRDYVVHGVGNDVNVRKNRTELDEVELMPRYFTDYDQPDLTCQLFGRTYDAPFGVAPMGLTGLIWPRAEAHLAAAAREQNIPYSLSMVGCATLEETREIAGENGWFQLYTPKEKEVRHDILRRCREAGYDTLIVTVDVPYGTRRAHDMRNGLSVPPRFDLRNLWQMMTHPAWALRMAGAGIPRFVNLAPYYKGDYRSRKAEIQASLEFLMTRLGVHISPDVLEDIRSNWPGTLIVKGVLDPDEAADYASAGANAIVVSNHGGRQLDAAPSSVSALPRIRERLGPDYPLLVDSGVRSGLDIARMFALGANFVLMGRPFMYSLGALDHRGPGHLIDLMKAELRSTMGQLGCHRIAELPEFLHESSVPR